MNSFQGSLRLRGQTHREFVETTISLTGLWDMAGPHIYCISQLQPEFEAEMFEYVFRCNPAFHDKWHRINEYQ